MKRDFYANNRLLQSNNQFQYEHRYSCSLIFYFRVLVKCCQIKLLRKAI